MPCRALIHLLCCVCNTVAVYCSMNQKGDQNQSVLVYTSKWDILKYGKAKCIHIMHLLGPCQI